MITDSSLPRDDWITAPTRLVGLRVSIQWANLNYYSGKVVRYTTSTGMHTVKYDDGEEKSHDMHMKTFRIEGCSYLWTPERVREVITQKGTATNLAASAGTGTYHTRSQDPPTYAASTQGSYYGSPYMSNAKAPPYISRYPNSMTTVCFNVCVDPKSMLPGDQVVLSGSLQCMGMWVAPVALQQSDIDGSLWSCALEVPLNMADTSLMGIMHYKYEIQTARGELISEGQYERTETRMRRHFFHTFRPNYTHPRFRGTTHVPNAIAVGKYIQERLVRLRRGDFTSMHYMASFRDMMECIPNTQRVIIEEGFNEFLDSSQSEAGNNLDYILCYLGMIGYFGVTSAEKYYQNQGGGTFSAAYPYVGYTQTLVNRKPPKPSHWCHYLADILATDELLHVQSWKGKFGRYNASLIGAGVQEAVERLSEYSSYKWLKLTPILEHFALRPRIVHPKAKADREEFVKMTSELCILVLEYQAVGASLLAEQEQRKAELIAAGGDVLAAPADAIGLGALGVDSSTGEIELPPPYQLSMARDWLFGVILYAPALSYLTFLFTEVGMSDIIREGIDVVGAFQERIEDEYWNSEAQFDTITSIVQGINQLKCPKIATAMLKNTSTTDKLNRVMDFLNLCVGYIGVTASAPEEAFCENLEDDNGVSGDWLELSAAAKEFVRRHHATEPNLEPDKGKNDNNWTQAWFTAPTAVQKKKLTEQELLEIRRTHMDDAFDTVSRFFEIPFFERHPSGLFFELSRCWFMTGKAVMVMSCLVELSRRLDRKHSSHRGVTSGAFLNYHVALSAHLSQHVVKVMKSAVDAHGGLSTVEYLTGVLSATGENSFYAQTLVYELVVYVTWGSTDSSLILTLPSASTIPLKTVLGNHDMWIEIYLWCYHKSGTRTDSQGHDLFRLVGMLCSMLANVKKQILEDQISLQDLQYIAGHRHALIELFEQLNILSSNDENRTLSPTVDDLLDRMERFEASMEHAQAYASFFCACGVKIDSDEVRQLIESLRVRYLNIMSSEFQTVLQPIIAMPHLAWLFELRSSDLFLHYWREVGKEVCIETVRASAAVDMPPALRRHRFDRGRRVNAARGAPHDNMMAELLNVFEVHEAENRHDAAGGDHGVPGIDENDDEEDPLPFVDGFDDQTASDMMAAYFVRQDAQNDAVVKIDHVVLTQFQVSHFLIPKVQEKWKALGLSILSRTINIVDLEKGFSSVSALNINEELRLLSLSNFEGTAIEDAEKKVLISSAIRDMNKFTFLCKLRKWIPSLLQLHKLLSNLCATDLAVDVLRTKFVSVLSSIQASWSVLTLSGISSLLTDVSGLFDEYPAELLNFLSCLGNSPDVTAWLLTQNSTEEFNRLLQVVRPCTDEPRLLSAIASLVHIRTLLLQPLYSSPPYEDLGALLNGFKCIDVGSAESGFDSEALWHLSNVASSFDGLMDVFERQTVSPGIKACYNLVEISERGRFVLIASTDASKVLSLTVASAHKNTTQSSEGEDGVASTAEVRTESIEYLLDLRSKLMMTEIPPELEEQINASVLIESFVQQFQLLCEMRDVLVKLHNSGHISFQEDTYERKFNFTLDGISQLQSEYEILVDELKKWGLRVKLACETHYFLNFFTMREILNLRKLVLTLSKKPESDSAANVVATPDNGNWKPPPPPPRATSVPSIDSEKAAKIDQIMSMGFSREHSAAAISRCGGNVEAALDFILSNAQYMDRIAVEEAVKTGDGKISSAAVTPSSRAVLSPQLQPLDEIAGLLHLVSSRVSSAAVDAFVEKWAFALVTTEDSDMSAFLSSLGLILGDIFDTNEEKDAATMGRPVGLPSVSALNRADTLIHVGSKSQQAQQTALSSAAVLEADADADDEKLKRIPVFVTCTEGPEFVIDATLSVYVRRGRLPEPGEVLFCTGETSMEDLTLLLMRFIFARNHGRGDSVFTVADLHKLSYASQCSFVEILRSFFREYGQDSAGTLLLISGVPRQVAINSLSSQIIDLPPLELKELRRSVQEALLLHTGETVCVASVVNGGGKSHYIKSQVSRRQKSCDVVDLQYRKIPIRESTDANRLVSLLTLLPRANSSGTDVQFAFHLDIGHVIPEVSNTLLFQLLYIGVVRDPASSRCYYRSPNDVYYIEVPNSPNNKTAEALRFCCLLPTVVLHVTEDTLDFNRPVFVDSLGTRIATPEYSELTFVCKWLRALTTRKLQHGNDDYDADYSPYMDVEISAVECFAHLFECCVTPEGPSEEPTWALFHSFLVFMNMQFTYLQEYPLTQGGILACIPGLENFKEVFVKLLIETSKDFSLRSVPQLTCVGPPPGSLYAIAGGVEDDVIKSEQGPTAVGDDDALPASLTMRREKSAEYQKAEHSAALMEPPVSIRQTSEEVVARFKNMISWEQSEHPIVAFRMDERAGGGVSGMDIISLNRTYLSTHMPANLIQTLEANRFEFNRDWSSITNDEGVAILRAVDGLGFMHVGGLRSIEAGYVMTVDNMLKMLSIQLRLRYNLPAIIMGETGCGKSTLIRNMCGILGVALHTLNVHGGMEDQDIIDWMNSKIAMAEELAHDSSNRIVLFLDEINTCNCMGLFKEIVCDRSMNGIPLLDNIKIIAACNPYRLRTTKSLYGGEEMAGLVFEHFSGNSGGHGHRAENVGTGIKDPLRNLVYRVHPLPESMIDHIFDFGALSAETEKLYIHAMLTEQLGIFNEKTGGESKSPDRDTVPGLFGIPKAIDYFEEFIEVFTELVCTAQECVRHIAEGERSVTSLRDVSRCVKIFLWFAQHFADTKGAVEGWDFGQFLSMRGATVQKYVRKCVILSLSYCYHARLPRTERSVLVTAITAAWRRLQASGYQGYQGYQGYYGQPRPAGGAGGYVHVRPKCPWLKLESSSFIAVLEDTQREFVSVMNLGEGIALNEALCENLFMILCSILNKIPIFVIGKPGSSKSLAMGLIQSNLNGDASEGPFLRSLPGVEVFSYQCSPLSTSGGIEQVFESSRRYLRQASNTVVVVLLDEVGLAEQSPHLPLKVLHKLLDEMLEGEAMVGISNWSLDPAKMNRAVHLYRPAPTIEDLSLTAEGMVRSANLKGYLQSLAKGYDETYREQEHFDFWGLREFYSTVRAINASLAQQRIQSGTETVSLDGPTLMNAILRNFGGRPHEMQKVVTCFFTNLGLPLPAGWENILIEQLISDNLKEPDARHLMLLTKSNAALSLLLDRNIVKKDRTEIIFGSDFSLDKTDLYICLQLQRIKHCMAEGITVVLVHCEALYESLYDLLNQHYVEYGGQIYVRIAFGTYTKLCPIHRTFRVVVIVEKREAYTRLAPPLLNRFEKQVFERRDVLRPWHLKILQRVQNFIALYCCKDFSKFKTTESYDVNNFSLVALRFAFCGFHNDFLSSLILAAEHSVFSSFEKENRKHNAENLKWKEIDALNIHDEEESRLRNLLEEAVLSECIDRLLWVSPPEAVCRVHGVSGGDVHNHILQEYSVDVMSKYFMQQRHSSLASFAARLLFGETIVSAAQGDSLMEDNAPHRTNGEVVESPSRKKTTAEIDSTESARLDSSWRDELGAQVVVVTHAPLDTQEAKSAVRSCCSVSTDVTSIVLHELDQERELRQMVSDFFKNAQSGSTLLVQCDPLAASKRRIEHTKFIIELARAKRYKQAADTMKANGGASSDSKMNDRDGGEEKTMEDGTPVIPQDVPQVVTAENAVDETCADRGIHVIMLIHLARGDDSGGEGRYCVDFDTRWKYAFVDSLSTAVGLPDIESMIGKSAVDIFNLLDAKKILMSAFRPSLARLNYFYERTSEDVRNQIICILRCLETPRFIDLILNILKSLIPQYTGELSSESAGKSSMSWLASSIDSFADRELQLAGTFQSALHGQILDITSTLLAVVVSHMFRNDTLQLYLDAANKARASTEDSGECSLWLYLFQMSFNGSAAVSVLKQRIENNKRSANTKKTSGVTDNRASRVVDVKGDGMDGSILTSKFPFSFYIVPVVDSMRKVGELLDESHLVRQFATTGLAMNLTERQTPMMLSRYVYDLMSMRCRVVAHMSRNEQALMFEHLLKIYSPDVSLENRTVNSEVDGSESKEALPSELGYNTSSGDESSLEYIAQIHWRYWRLERFISLSFDLIHANPLAKTAAFDFIMALTELNEYAYFRFLILVIKFLRPENQTWCSDVKKYLASYSSWLKIIPQFKITLFSMLDLLELDETHEHGVINEWNKIELMGHFVKDCCIPLEMDPARVSSYSGRFGDGIILVSPEGCKAVISLLSEIKRELGLGQQVADDLICPITQLRFISPVKAADGITYEMTAITDWMQKAMRSPMTNEPLRDAILTPDARLLRRLEVVDTCDLNRVLDFFVFDLVFAPGKLRRKQLTPSLIVVLLQLASGSYVMNISTVSKFQSQSNAYNQSDHISLSYAGVLSLFHELFKVSELSSVHFGSFGGSLGPIDGTFNIFNSLTQSIENAMGKELQDCFESSGHLDTMLSSVYVSVRDGLFAHSAGTFEAVALDFCSRSTEIAACLTFFAGNSTTSLPARLLLDCIVHMRSLLKLTAECLCDSASSLSVEKLDDLCAKVDDFLSTNGIFGGLMGVNLMRSARMYFLKCIERKRGVSFLRSALMSIPLSEATWVVEWKMSGDAGFSRFIGSNKLPKWNPFVFFPLFNDLQQIVASYVSSKNLTVFSASLKEAIDRGNRKKVLAAFILAGFHEVGMLQLLPTAELSGLDSIIESLRQWIRSSPVLDFCSSVEKEMVECCVFGFSDCRTETKGVKYSRAFGCTLNEFSSSEEVIMHRILVHLVAVSFSADDTHPFVFMKELMTSPAGLIESFFPTMPEDLTKMAQEAMGGRWYACPNGHPFYVDQCGRPTEVNTCVECGAEIGGEDHNLLSSNKDLGDAGTGYFKKSVLDDRSEKNYCIGSVEQERDENKVFSTRELGPTAVRIIRLLMHTALAFGSRFSSNSHWGRGAHGILNSAYCSAPDDLATFFEEHLFTDWDMLTTMLTLSIDDISVVLHGILVKAMSVDYVPFFKSEPIPDAAPVDYSCLTTTAARAQWERTVGGIFVGSVINASDVKQKAAEIYGHCCGQEDDSNSAFACSLLEKVSVETIPAAERRLSLPGLWLYTRHFSLDHFTMSLNMQPDAADRYPALTRFLAEEPQLRALKYMPLMFEWFRLLKNKCAGHLDRETARKKTVGELMFELDDTERFKFDKAFSGFAAAWNESWPHVQKFGCIRFPVDYNNVVMNSEVGLSFSLPNEQDEGNCPLALAHYLTDKHNNFVQVADESRLLRDKRAASVTESESQSRAEVISSRFVTSAHTIRYNLYEELVPWLEKSCVAWNVDGAGYDFAKAEALLVDRVLTGLPAIDFEQHGFQYMFEQHLQGGLTSLRAKLKQISLPKDAIEAIKRDITTPAAAHQTLGFLETVISFLTATGGSIVKSLDDSLGTMLLSKYTSSVLMMSEDISSRAISQLVQLRHLECLWETLTEMTACDIFAKVHEAYKEPLSERSRQLLQDALKNPGFDVETLLCVMKTFILDQLQDKVIDSKISVAICVGDCEVGDVYLSDAVWFTDYFPNELPMSEIVGAYVLLSEGGVDDSQN